jgi:CHAT domain-containing protein
MSNPYKPSEAFDRSYNTLQRASSSAAAIAVFKLAARFAAGTGELAKLVRKDQDLIAGSENLDKSLIAALSKPPGERNASAEDQIRRRIDAIKSERERLEETFNRSFPDYAALSKPQPLSLKDALLADDEALIALDFGKKPVRITTAPSYAWIITSTDAYWVELEISSDVLNDQVKALREALSFHFDKPFDTQLAFKIYQETFGVFADKIASKKRLSIVTNGALTSLPPQLLVTKEPGGKKLKDVDWLVRSYAVTILPPVASLKILRTVTATSLPTEPMIAFADPVFSKVAHRASHQQVAIKRFYSGTQIDVVSLGEHLEQLPETRKEVQTIGKELKADAKDIILGAAATVTAVKQAKLDQYRIRYFATHGLVAGDIAVCEEQG